MRSSLCLAILATLLLAALASLPLQAQTCPAGFSPRLIMANSCGEDAWMVEIPPGSKAAVQNQWKWFSDASDKTSTLANGGVVGAKLLKAGDRQTICVPDKGAPGGNFRFFMGCPGGNSDPFNLSGCTLGAFAGDRAAVNTLFEPTFGCKPSLSGQGCAFNPSDPAQACQNDPNSANCAAIASVDNFDISTVDGFTIPLRVDAQPLSGQSCNRLSTDAGMLDLASCPREDSKTVYSDNATQQGLINNGIKLLTSDGGSGALQACSAPYKWMQLRTVGDPPNPEPSPGECSTLDNTFNSSCFYSGAGCDPSDPAKRCPVGSGTQQKVGPTGDGKLAIQNTNWVQDLYGLGYNGYTWQYGDQVGDQACGWGSTITVTLCPKGGVPSRAGQVWTFSAATGSCTTEGALAQADGQTTFASLAECQQAKSRYLCDDQSQTAPYPFTAALWRADPQATISGAGFTYAEVQAKQRLVCKTAPYVIGSTSYNVPQCNYVYTGDDSQACPSSGVGAPSPLPTAFNGQGRAAGVGTGRSGGELQISGSFTLQKNVNFNRITIELSQLLGGESKGVNDLVTDKRGKSFLPSELVPVVNWDRRRTVFARSAFDPTRTQLVVTQAERGRKAAYDFVLTAENLRIAQPVACAAGDGSVKLKTSFTLARNDSPITTVAGLLEYRCKGAVLFARPPRLQ